MLRRPAGNGRRKARKHLADLKAQQPEVDRMVAQLEAKRDDFRLTLERTLRGEAGT